MSKGIGSMGAAPELLRSPCVAPLCVQQSMNAHECMNPLKAASLDAGDQRCCSEPHSRLHPRAGPTFGWRSVGLIALGTQRA